MLYSTAYSRYSDPVVFELQTLRRNNRRSGEN